MNSKFAVLIFALVIIACWLVMQCGKQNTVKEVTKVREPKAIRVTPAQPQDVEVKQQANSLPGLILKELVETHPNPEIRKDFKNLVESGRVKVYTEELVGRQSGGGIVSVFWDKEKHILCFNFPASKLQDQSLSLLQKQDLIYAGYQIVKQARAGKLPPESFQLWPEK